MSDGDNYFSCLESIGKPEFPGMLVNWKKHYDYAGNGVKFDCKAQGTQPISYKWTKNGRPLTLLRYQARGWMLRIDDLTPDDEGNYTCIASNIHGNNSCTYELSVYGKARLHLPFCLFGAIDCSLFIHLRLV